MRILVVSNLFPPDYIGGYELGCSQVSEELFKLGHEIEVLTSLHEISREVDYPPPSFPVHRKLELYVPFDKPAPLMRSLRHRVGKRNFVRTKERIQEFKPDVIYFWSLLRLTLGPLRAALASKYPLAYRWGDAHILGYKPAPLIWKPRSLYRYVMDNWIYPKNSFQGIAFKNVSCISQSLKKELIDEGLPMEGCQVNYNGIPLEWFPCKENIGVISSPVRLLYVGQLHPYKGVHTALKAAHRLVSQYHKECVLTIAGCGTKSYQEELESLALSGSAQIRFLGKIPYKALSEIYRSHDIFIFPSLWSEPQGVTYLEAMASGIPVISTKEGGHGEILCDGKNALSFQGGNEEELAYKMFSLVNDRDLYRKIAYRGQEEVRAKFSMKNFALQELSNLEKAVCHSGG